MKNRFKKLIAMLSCIAVLCTVFTSSAFAVENEETSKANMVALEETDLSIEDVCNLFNITEEEAAGAQIYATDDAIRLAPGLHDLGTLRSQKAILECIDKSMDTRWTLESITSRTTITPIPRIWMCTSSHIIVCTYQMLYGIICSTRE